MGYDNPQSRSWEHSRQAFEKLETCFIGDLYNELNQKEWILRKNRFNTAEFTAEDWILNLRVPVSSKTNLYQFENSDFYVKMSNRGVRWIGRHFMVSTKKKSRLYSLVSSLDPLMIQYRNYMTEKYDNLAYGMPLNLKSVPEYPKQSRYLTFLIKDYGGKTGVSTALSQASLGDSFKITGPIVSKGVEKPKKIQQKKVFPKISDFSSFLIFSLGKRIRADRRIFRRLCDHDDGLRDPASH